MQINTYEHYLQMQYSIGEITLKEYHKELYRLYNNVTACGEVMHLDAYGYDVESMVQEAINA